MIETVKIPNYTIGKNAIKELLNIVDRYGGVGDTFAKFYEVKIIIRGKNLDSLLKLLKQLISYAKRIDRKLR